MNEVPRRNVKKECCCEPRSCRAITAGLILLLIGLALKAGLGIAEISLLIGAVLVVKGLLLKCCPKK